MTTTHFELATYARAEKEPRRQTFPTARQAYDAGRRALFPEESEIVEFQVFAIERRLLGGEQARES